MIGMLKRLFLRAKAEPPPPPPPIEPGSVWRLKGEPGDPFEARPPCDVVVLEAKAGWVRYSMGGGLNDCRNTEAAFRWCYEPLPCECVYATLNGLCGWPDCGCPAATSDAVQCRIHGPKVIAPEASPRRGWHCSACRSGGTGVPAIRSGTVVCPLCLTPLTE